MYAVLFGSLDLDYLPLEVEQLPAQLRSFCQDAGGFALLGIWVWLVFWLARVVQRGAQSMPILAMAVAVFSTALFALGGVGSWIHAKNSPPPSNPFQWLESPPGEGKWFDWCFTIGGASALLGVIVPFAMDCLKMRWRRIYALARLSVIEALRNRYLVVFLIFLIPALFPAKWFFSVKPETELSTNVEYIYGFMMLFLMLAAAIIASFSLPNDIRRQTIHTIVTKPVERFEIVVGRFSGFLFLLTTVLLAVTLFSWLTIIFVSRVDAEAREESMKARQPVYGDLAFQGPAGFQGENVGREYDRRRYIPGGKGNPYRAIWHFSDNRLKRELAQMPNDAVKCEFKFDIFRTTKGEENKGIFASFFFVTHQANEDMNAVQAEYKKRLREQRITNPNPVGNAAQKEEWQRLAKIVGEMGYFEFEGKEVVDYHTLYVYVPSSIFAKAYEGKPPMVDHPVRGNVESARLFAAVRCDSATQYLGVKQNDLYLLASEGSFHWNYFKGVAGLWLRLCLVIGIAVSCSTYLNGVVSFLADSFLIGLGFVRSFIIVLALLPAMSPDLANPGPTDSFRKLVKNESLGTSPDTTNPTQRVTMAVDDSFRWCMRRMLNVVPNTERLTWTDYVAKGFNVPLEDVALNGLMVGAYLLMWTLLGHYLIKWREVATW